jgi:hypothetical protein
MCVLIFSTTFSETCRILRRIELDMISHESSCEVPVIILNRQEFKKNAYIFDVS